MVGHCPANQKVTLLISCHWQVLAGRSPARGMREAINRSMFLLYVGVSLPLSLPSSLALKISKILIKKKKEIDVISVPSKCVLEGT